MKRQFVELPNFWKMRTDPGLSDNDLAALERFMCCNPEAGELIKGTGGLKKVRWNLGNKGKQDGVRVLYILGSEKRILDIRKHKL